MTIFNYRKMIGKVVIGFLLLATLGCSSLGARAIGGLESIPVYPGTAADVLLLGDVAAKTSLGRPFGDYLLGTALITYALLDFPFSLVFDTVILPFDAIDYYTNNLY